MVRIPDPTGDESDDGAPYLPAILLSVDEDGMVRLPVMMRHAVYDPNEAVNDFLRGMIEEKCKPKKIYVRTEETMFLLEEFCRKAGIKLVREDNLELLEEARETMLERFRDEEDDNEEAFGLNEIIKMLENIPDRELRTMPEFMIHQIIEMADSGMLPKHIVQKIRRNFK